MEIKQGKANKKVKIIAQTLSFVHLFHTVTQKEIETRERKNKKKKNQNKPNQTNTLVNLNCTVEGV